MIIHQMWSVTRNVVYMPFVQYGYKYLHIVRLNISLCPPEMNAFLEKTLCAEYVSQTPIKRRSISYVNSINDVVKGA